MYKYLGAHVYPDGYTYEGPATECYYSYYVSKDFNINEVYSYSVEQSGIAASDEGASMLLHKAWVDQGGSNNLFTVRFDALAPGISNGGISALSQPWWVVAIIVVSILGTSAYIIHTIRDISYSPSGPAMWDALKWVGVGVVGIGAIYLVDRFLPRKAKV